MLSTADDASNLEYSSVLTFVFLTSYELARHSVAGCGRGLVVGC